MLSNMLYYVFKFEIPFIQKEICMHIESTPFTLLILAAFSPALETGNPPVIKTDPFNFDQALKQVNPNLNIPVDRSLVPDGNIAVSIEQLSDFRPKNIIKKNPFLKRITEAQKFIRTDSSPASFKSSFPELLQLVTFPEKDSSAIEDNSAALDDILSLVDVGESSSSSQSRSLNNQLERIQASLLESIFADPDFRRLESAWRGLELLCRQIPAGSESTVELCLIPVTRNNLSSVIDRVQEEFSDSPPDLILLDSPMSNSARSMAELEKVMNLAETLLTPAIVQFSPDFFEISNWAESDSLPFIPSLLEGAEYGRWKTLRQASAAGWVMTCIGSVMARTMHTREAGYETTSLTEKGPLWTSSVWAAAALCARSLARYDRPTLFANHSMVRLEGLPLAEGAIPAPLTPPLGTERIKSLRQAGITAPAFNGDQVFILSATSMDGGPFNLRLYLSRLIHFLIMLSTEKREEFADLENGLTQAVGLFLQKQGYPEPADLTIKAANISEGVFPLEISLTPGSEILPGNTPITFAFNW